MTSKATKYIVTTALFAALIFLSVSFFKIEVAPRTMVHMGNAMVVVSFLVLGTHYAMIAATVGLGVFDVLNGYLSSVHFIILESVIVVAVLGVVFNLLKKRDTLLNVAILGVVAGLVKIIVVFVRYYITYTLTVGNDTVLTLTLTRLSNTLITAGVTAIAVPILYFAVKPVVKQLKL